MIPKNYDDENFIMGSTGEMAMVSDMLILTPELNCIHKFILIAAMVTRIENKSETLEILSEAGGVEKQFLLLHLKELIDKKYLEIDDKNFFLCNFSLRNYLNRLKKEKLNKKRLFGKKE